MKKIILAFCCIVCMLSLLCFSACEAPGGETTEGSVTDGATADSSMENAENADVIITLSAEPAEVAPGEEFTITCTVKESKLFAAGDLMLSFDKEQMSAEFVEENVKSMYSFSNEVNSGYQYSAYVASTAELENALLFTVYCVADEDCKSGDEIKITLSCEDWLVGVDEKGDDVISIADSVATNSLSIKVR